jgi:hypothetical protein
MSHRLVTNRTWAAQARCPVTAQFTTHNEVAMHAPPPPPPCIGEQRGDPKQR